MLLVSLLLVGPAAIAAPSPQLDTAFESVRLPEGQFSAPTVINSDLDGDGLSDTIVCDSRTRTVSWIRSQAGIGAGVDAGGEVARLEPLFEVDFWAFAGVEITMAVADLDGDGDNDLALAGRGVSFAETSVAVAWNDGSNQLTLVKSPQALQGSPRSLAVLDLDSDGQQELAIAMDGPTSVGDQVFVVDHTGGVLTAPTRLISGARTGANSLRTGDVTGDGVDDLILRTVLRSGSVTTLMRIPPGTSFPLDEATLEPVDNITVPLLRLDAAEVADLDGDGDADLAVLSEFFPGPVLEVWLQGPAGTFTRAPDVPVPAGEMIRELKIADRDADGRLDLFTLVVPAQGLQLLQVHTSLGSGSFSTASTALDVASFSQIQPADQTGDGRADLVATRSAPSAAVLFAKAAPGVGVYETLQRLGEHLGRGAIAVLDANGDGRDDIAAVTQGRGAREEGIVGFKLALPDGGFGPLQPLTGPMTSPDLGDRALVAGDFTGDGLDDLLVSDAAGQTFELHRGLGDATFAAPIASLSLSSAPPFVSAQDLDQDGVLDLVYTKGAGSRVGYAFGDPSGVFVGQSDISGGFSQAVHPAIADFDGDGDLDLAYLAGGAVEVSLQNSTRSFAPRMTVVSNLSVQPDDAVAAGDLDGDGLVDLLIPGRVRLMGLGGGAFDAPVAVTGRRGTEPQLIDLDLDGDLDVLIKSGFDRYSSEALTLDTYSLGVPLSNASGFELPLASALMDLDSDGDVDVLASLALGLIGVFVNSSRAEVGDGYCGPPVPNSTGQPGAVSAFALGEPLGGLQLIALDLPESALGFFLCSRTQADIASVPGSVGRLCLGGAIGRFVGPGQVQDSGPSGGFSLSVDPNALPTPDVGLVRAFAGETWSFQAWHRDMGAGGSATSNFTSAVAVTF